MVEVTEVNCSKGLTKVLDQRVWCLGPWGPTTHGLQVVWNKYFKISLYRVTKSIAIHWVARRREKLPELDLSWLLPELADGGRRSDNEGLLPHVLASMLLSPVAETRQEAAGALRGVWRTLCQATSEASSSGTSRAKRALRAQVRVQFPMHIILLPLSSLPFFLFLEPASPLVHTHVK